MAVQSPAERSGAAILKPSALEKAQTIAAQFEFGDDEISDCVERFLQQMGVQTKDPGNHFRIVLKPHCRSRIARKNSCYVSNPYLYYPRCQRQRRGIYMVKLRVVDYDSTDKPRVRLLVWTSEVPIFVCVLLTSMVILPIMPCILRN